jgi:hypothetical protein
MRFLFRYPNIIVFVLGLIFSLILYYTGGFAVFFDFLGSLKHFGLFFLGVCYSFSASAGFSSIAFIAIGNETNPLVVSFLGGVGAMVGDLLIFRFVKVGMMNELRFIAEKRLSQTDLVKIRNFFGSGLTRFFGMFIGFLLIASPFPDELGVIILAFSGMRARRSAPVFFFLNAIGIYLLALVGAANQ